LESKKAAIAAFFDIIEKYLILKPSQQAIPSLIFELCSLHFEKAAKAAF
jgi:hypothetical protein